MSLNSSAQLKIVLFGTEPVIQWLDHPISITRKDALHLLVFTAEQRREAYDREKLTTILFGIDSKGQRLREALMWLNRTLKESGFNVEILHGHPLVLNRDMVWVDAHEFSERAKRLLAYSSQEISPEFIHEVNKALNLYRDHFLNDYVFESYELNVWHDNRQTELATLRHSLFELIIQFHIQQGSLTEAQGIAETWLGSLNPGFVPLEYLIWVALKKRLYSVVQHYLARLQRYQDEDPTFFGTDVATWRALIQNEEDPPLTLLHLPAAGIMTGEIAPDNTSLNRSDALREITRLITNSQFSGAIGLTGLPGVGKTWFARRVTWALRQIQPNFMAAWFELTQDCDLETLLNDILSQLGLHHLLPLPYVTKQKRFKQIIRAYSCLIVIDEATSHRLANVEFLEALIALFDEVRLLLIARELPGTTHYPFDLSGFDAPQIRQYLIEQLPQLKGEADDVFDAATQITGGLPLVVNWLVGFLRDRRFQIKSFIKALSKLQSTHWTLETAQENYQYILNWLWLQLLLDEKNILYTAAMFSPSDGVSLEDLHEIADSAFVLKQDKLLQKVEKLLALSLLHEQADSTRRFMLHPTTFMYIQLQIDQIAEIQPSFQMSAIHRAYIERFLRVTRQHEGAFAQLDLHKNNLLRMFEVVLLHNAQPRMQLEIIAALSRTYDYFEKRGLYSKAESLLTAALNISDIPDEERVHLLHHLGQAAFKQGQLESAERWLSTAWEFAQQLELVELYGIILRDLGRVCLHQGAYAKAMDYFQHGQDHVLQQEQPLLRGQIMSNIGVIAYQRGNYEDAKVQLEQTVRDLADDERINQTYEYQDLLQYTQNLLGVVELAGKEYDQAKLHMQQSLVSARKLNNPERIAQAYLNLGALSYYQSEFDTALDYLTQGSVVAEYLHHGELLNWFKWNKGAIHVVQGNFKYARRSLQAALNEATELGLKPALPHIFLWLGILHFCQNQIDMARTYFRMIFEQVALNPWSAALGLFGISLCARYELDLAMQGSVADAHEQIAHELVSAQIDRSKLSAIRKPILERAEQYFQVALEDMPGLRGFHIVDALALWLAQ